MVNQPTGTVTFLFTDIEGSTKLWEQYPEVMQEALSHHDTLLRDVIETHGGYVFKTVGDAFCAAFTTATTALAAAILAQRGIYAIDWGRTPIKVRMGLHTGVAEIRDGDYYGSPLNHVSRLMSAGHGGQILLSRATYELVCDQLAYLPTLPRMEMERGVSVSDVYNKVRTTLLRCGSFSSNQDLQSLFVDARIRPWRDRLPEVNDPMGRVRAIIDLLYDHYNEVHENALVLFLRVLSEQIDPNDACHLELTCLASELDRATRKSLDPG